MTPTWLDRAIGYISPAAGLRRIQARAAAETLAKRYGAWPDEPRGGIGRAVAGPNVPPATARRIRWKIRELAQTNANIALGIEEWETHAAPISCRAMLDVEDRDQRLRMNEAVDTAWYDWGLKADYQGLTDFDGLQRMVVRALIQDGMALVRRRTVPLELGVRPSFQLQLIEVDYLDEAKDRSDRTNGTQVVGGIQFGPDGRRQGAWLHTQHPSSPIFTSSASVFVPIEDLLIIFDPERPGQQIGNSRLRTVVDRAADIDAFEESRLIRAQVEACMVASVTDPDADPSYAPPPPTSGAPTKDGQTIAPYVTDAWGRSVEEFQSGMVMYGPPGRKIDFHQPTGTGGYSEYTASQYRGVAAGVGVSYEQLTGDLSNVSFISGRLGVQGFRRRVRKLQDKVLLPQFLRPVFHDWFIPTARSFGIVPTQRLWSKWTPPRWESIQPLDDANADLIDMRSGAKTLNQVCNERGLDFADQVAEIAENNATLDAAGVVLDSDPRKRTKSGLPADTKAGAAQSGQDEGPPPGEGEKERADRVFHLRKVNG